MTIRDNLTIINQWEGRHGHNIKACVIHSTAGSYQGSINWFKNPKAMVSAHYVVSTDGEISKCVQEKNAAWHAGLTDREWAYLKSTGKVPKVIQENWLVNPNFISIGVEITDNNNRNWHYPLIQYQAVVELTADICKRNNIPISRDYVVMHKTINPLNKIDPIGQWKHDKFIQDVRLTAEKILSPQPVYAWEGTVTVRDDIHSLFVRSGPARIYPQAGSKILYPGDTVNVVEFVEGEKIASVIDGKVVESPYWWKSKLGHYFWAGGTVEQPGLKKNDDNLLINLGKEGVNNMTPEEKASKLVEFDARKASLDARRLELDEAYKVNEAALEVYDADLAVFNSVPVVEVPVEVTPVEEVKSEEVVVEPVLGPDTEVEAVEEDDASLFAKFKEWMRANR